MATILKDCVIALSGTFVGHRQDAIGQLIKKHGGKYSTKVNAECTHLITTSDANGVKNKQAASVNGINIVSLDWLLDSDKSGKREGEASYSLASPSSNTQSTAPDSSAGTRRSARQKNSQTNDDNKRALDADDDDDDDVKDKGGKTAKKTDGPPAKKLKNGGRKAVQKAKKKDDIKSESEDEEDDDDKSVSKSGDADSTPRVLKVPVDSSCPSGSSFDVYIDDDQVIYDAALNQTNSGHNNNKFYIIQLLQLKGGGPFFRVWNHWGRVGEAGQTKLSGGMGLRDALGMFEKKFKDKTGLLWIHRNETPRTGKYTYIERNYEDEDSEDEAESKKKKAKKTSEGEEVKPVECTLAKPVQELVSLIFNQQLWQATMANMSYDANKLPLGKLSKRTLRRGYEILKELSDITSAPASTIARTADAITQLSDQYFTVIPHAFGRSRPPRLNTQPLIKREVELLETLTDMEIANEIMNSKSGDEDTVHELDRHFNGLNLNEMSPLDPSSTEFQELEDYLVKSHGKTHYIKYKLKHIFKIDRKGEKERFEESPYADIQNSNRRLLWHGSRATNYGGILSQGLRIAPPEAPSTGYMFGKGVYFADISSKSANYCCSHASNQIGVLLLCDVELGDPMLELTSAEYNAGEIAKKQNKLATLGMGKTIPAGWKDAKCLNTDLDGVLMPDCSTPPVPDTKNTGYLQYNEYIVYDVAQIRQKYLFYVQMT